MSLMDLAQHFAETIPGKELLSIPVIRHKASKLAIEYLASRTLPRPHPFSLWSAEPKPAPLDQAGPVNEYTSWPGLTDRSFSSRHLPPSDPAYISSLPPNDWSDSGAGVPGPVTALFKRKTMMKGRSSVLFMFFAQWFTDSFLRADSVDRRRNSSNHEIDLCQIYGLTEATARLLRSGKNGKLSSQFINGEEYPDYLYETGIDGRLRVKDRYAGLPYISNGLLDKLLALQSNVDQARRAKLFATGLERGNSSIGYVAMSTLFLREHNRVCDELRNRNPEWAADDERIFQTARLINMAMLLRIVIENYINHIAGDDVLVFDNSYAEGHNWYRTNWMAVEFDMLYRWHGLVPDTVNINGVAYKPPDFQTDNALLQRVGLAALINGASHERAGKIGLFNTPAFLLGAEFQNIKMGRDFRLRSFNDYRQCFNLEPFTEWEQFSDDPRLLTALKDLYQDVDGVEFVVGLFAEQAKDRALFGELLTTMVAVDAFTQALTNPILSINIFNATTFTAYGLELIGATPSLQAVVDRNVRTPTKASFDI